MNPAPDSSATPPVFTDEVDAFDEFIDECVPEEVATAPPALRSDWRVALTELRARVDQFVRESAGRARTPEDQAFLNAQGQSLQSLIDSCARGLPPAGP